MVFKRILPPASLEKWIECYWIVEDRTAVSSQQKIIPDGFTEMIFHFGDPYRIKLDATWEVQSKSLLAGQISRYFYLENTGAISILGIKLKPTAITHLYGLPMHTLTDKVADLSIILKNETAALEKNLRIANNYDSMITILNNYFTALSNQKQSKNPGPDIVIEKILQSHGMVNLPDLCTLAGVGERQLENLFKRYIGLSPKFYARIIRFNYIFQLVQEKEQNWSAMTYEAAYYDQSHFIRNFKSFTGESPSAYSFDEKNLANFFLKK